MKFNFRAPARARSRARKWGYAPNFKDFLKLSEYNTSGKLEDFMTYPSISAPCLYNQIEEGDIGKLKEYATWFLTTYAERIPILIGQVHATSGYEQWKADFSPHSLDVLGEWFFAKMHDFGPKPKTAEQILDHLQGWFLENIIPDVHGITPEAFFDRFKSWYLNAVQSQPEKAGEVAMEWFYNNIGARNEEGKRDLEIFKEEWEDITLSLWAQPVDGPAADASPIPIAMDVGFYFSRIIYRYVKHNYPDLQWHPAFGNHKYKHYYSHGEVLDRSENDPITANFDPLFTMVDIGFDMLEGKKSASAVHELYDLWVDRIRLFAEQLPILKELASIGVRVQSVWEFRYAENPDQRSSFSKAVPIVCKHLKMEHDPYILEALAAALCNEELCTPEAVQEALDILDSKHPLPKSARRFLILAAIRGGDEAQQAKGQAYADADTDPP